MRKQIINQKAEINGKNMENDRKLKPPNLKEISVGDSPTARRFAFFNGH